MTTFILSGFSVTASPSGSASTTDGESSASGSISPPSGPPPSSSALWIVILGFTAFGIWKLYQNSRNLDLKPLKRSHHKPA